MQKQLLTPAPAGLAGFARRLRIGLKTRALAAGLLAAGAMFSAHSAQAQTAFFSEGFESGLNGWTLVNGTQTNQFFVGTAAASAGTQSAYITNDAGVTNAYTNTSSAVSHIYKDVVFPASQRSIQLTFKWRAVGEGSASDWDNLKVYLTSPNTPITAGTQLPVADRIGASWYNLSNATTYSTVNLTLPNNLSGTTQRLVFSWKNDDTDGAQPPASIDEISITSITANPLSGIYTINSANPTGGTNFASFTDAITAINTEGNSGPVTFNVLAGQTFTENAPALTASGTATNIITFQKSGTGANPVIRPTGGTGTSDAGITLTGADYITFNGIDININTGSAVEFGYLVRNASATNGAMNNTITNASITLNKANTSSIAVLQTSNSSFGAGITPTVAGGSNQNNTYTNLTIQSVYNGILLTGGSSTFFDSNNTVSNNTVGAATAADMGGGTTTAYGIKATLQNNVKIFNNEVRNITTTTAAIDGIFLDQGLGMAEVYRNNVHDLSLTTATGTAVITGMRMNLATTAGHTSRVYNNMVTGLNHAFNGTASATRRVIGIFTQSNGSGAGSTHNIDFNSVRVETAAAYTASSTAFEIGTTSGTIINVRNNILTNFSPAQTGVAKHYVWVTTSASLTGIAGSVSNYNLLYVANTTNGFIGLTNTTDRATLGNWQGATNQDANSKSSNPQFISASNLHISPTAPTEVESNGSYFNGAITWVTNDFDNAVRNTTTPDLGADEETFTPADFTGPVITFTPLGRTSILTNRTLTATIVDPAGVPTSGALVPRIYFSKSLVLNTFVSTPGVLTSGTATNGTWTFTIDYSLIGGAAVGDQIAYYVVAQDNLGNIGSTPGGITGTDVNTITGGSNVNLYTINAAIPAVVTVPGTYPSLTLAGGLFAAINAGVLTSNVEVTITGDLTAETGATPLNQWFEDGVGNYTLTIRPDAAVNRTISGTSVAGFGLIRSNGADRFTIDGSFNGNGNYLTIIDNAAVNNTFALLVTTGAVNNTFRNLNIKTGSNAVATTHGIFTSGIGNNNLLIENNNISKAYVGITAQNDATSPAVGMIIRNNTIGSATAADYVGFKGIVMQNAIAPLIKGNTVSVKTGLSINPAGIELGTGANEVKVDGNTISGIHNTNTSGYGAYGINILAGNNHMITNNMISDISTFNYNNTTTTWNAFGIRIDAGTNIKLYHNSVNLFGPLQAPTATHFTADLLVLNSTVTGLDIRNNIFANTMEGIASGKSYAVYAPTGTTFANINNNDYYVSGINGVIGYLGSDKPTLADWKQATGQDVNSLNVEPLFSSPTDLHMESNNLTLNNAGTPIAAVTVDFDNQPRSATTPDIGADEFTPAALDLGVVALVSPTGKNCYGAGEQVIVRLENLGLSPVNFTATNATVTVNVTGAATQAYTVTLNNNNRNGGQPLAPGDTLNIIAGTLNMSAPGVYTFNSSSAVTTGGIDGNASNNALTAVNLTVNAPDAGTATASQASICQSGVTTLSVSGNVGGDIKWQSATSATGPFTDIAGATGPSYTLTTPITATTYYQAVATCGTNSDNSNVVTVTVNNPTVASVTGDARCGAGAVNLTATPSAGATIVWFDGATSTTPVATGTTYAPNVTATTTYYAEAIVGNTYNAGLPGTGAYGTFGSPGGTGYGLTLTTTQPGVIESAYVYPVSAGNVVVQLYTRAGVAVGSPVTVPVSATDVGNKTLIPLNIPVLVPGNYNLVNIAGSVFLNRYNPYSGPAYPLNSAGNVFSITGGATSASSTPGATTYYSFFDLSFSNACRSGRQPVVATVNALPTPTITGLNATYCTTAAAVPLTGSIAGSTFTVNGTAATTFNPATLGAGTYTVVVSSTNASNCTGTATQTVTVTAPAATPTITASGATTICAGSNVVLTAASATTGATYEWFLNGTLIPNATGATFTASAAGAYTAVATAAGCASPASTATTVTVNPTPATPTISQNGGVLTSSSTTGNQWLLNGVAIPGATAQTYVTTANGNYTLVVTANGCPSAASAVKNVTNTGMGEALAGMHVDVYPNPASGSFKVKLSGYQQDAAVVLYNLAGQQITATKASAEGKASNISLKGLAAGTYLLKVTSEKGVQVTRLIVQ